MTDANARDASNASAPRVAASNVTVPDRKRIWVVSGSAGNGHTMAGVALTDAFQRHPLRPHVEHIDAVRMMRAGYGRIYRSGYLKLVDRMPAVWRALYEASDKRGSALTHGLTRLCGATFLRACQEASPDAVVCTHFLGPEILSPAIARGRLQTQLEVVVTDHDSHRIWYWPSVSRYFVPTPIIGSRLTLRFAVPPAHIEATGIPVRRQFVEAPSMHDARAMHGLRPDSPVVLFLSAGFAAGDTERAIHGMWLDRRDIQVVAICGRNERMRRRVARLARPSGATLRVLGFVDDVASWMATADLVIGKSGGVTVSECMAMGKPLLISGSIPGQEERNADAVVEAGAGFRALTAEDVRLRVSALLGEPARLARAAHAAKAFGRPGAADAIAARVMTRVSPHVVVRGPHFHGAGHGAGPRVPTA